ncbi:MAG: polysaccharide deacetylase family protein, partial [Steroidobacteraceae bacterium]
ASHSAPTAWRATPLVRASGLLHGAAAGLTALHPYWWPWTLGSVVADHLLLTALGLWPRSRALGSNWTHLPPAAAARGEVAITFDDGPDPAVTPQVLSILDSRQVRATFFCIGERAEQHAACVRACVAAGHAVENLSYHHRHNFALLGPARLRAELLRAQEALARVSGSPPRFFRAPAGLRNLLLDPLLQRQGLQLASWTRRGFDTVSDNVERVLGRLTRDLRAGDILLLHDGHAARSAAGAPVVLQVLPLLIDAIVQRALRPVTLREALQ